MWNNWSSPSSSRSSSRNTSPGLDSLGSFVSRSPSPYSQSSTTESQRKGGVKIGDRVIIRSSVGDSKPGILRYIGPLEIAKGDWAGVELFYPEGKNDGTVGGREYFRCPQPYGLFVPLRKVEMSPVNGVKGLQQTKWITAEEYEGQIYVKAPRNIRV